MLSGAAHAQPLHYTGCVKPKTHNDLVRKTLRFWHRGPDYRAIPVNHDRLDRLGSMRSCAKRLDAGSYKRMRGFWDHRKTRYDLHRRVDLATPYGPWAVPPYIVMRESRGDRCAMNPTSTAGGYYQFLDSSWYAAGGVGSWAPGHPAACAPDWMQHLAAARLWNGGAGASHWAATA